ncbi:MAG: CPBP family intramembrane metalloprotease [Pontiellaceae bacterium]|jgi:membrane protease YdiL (CAAX protease family)|nr:CPBP family intramembrane metalloprotease [Pontiellaceae bacterium]
MTRDRLRPLCPLALLFLFAPALALLSAPWVYQMIQQFAAKGSVLDAPFYRVTARVVLVSVLLFLYPAYRLSGFRSRADYGLPSVPDRWTLIRLGILLGVTGMFLIYLLGAVTGVFAWDLDDRPVSCLVFKTVEILISGLAVGLFEEILFRGFVFGSLRNSLGLIPAIIFGSLFFSSVHLMRPLNPAVLNQWNSGFLLFNDLFARASKTLWQEAGTLFFMGVILSVICHWTKSVYVAIGLHAGWVWVMMFFRLFMDNQNTRIGLFGTTDWISKSWIGTGFSIVFLLVIFLLHKKWKALAPQTSTI